MANVPYHFFVAIYNGSLRNFVSAK